MMPGRNLSTVIPAEGSRVETQEEIRPKETETGAQEGQAAELRPAAMWFTPVEMYFI